MGQAYSEVFPPKPHWLPENMPDMTGKVAIVTGGNAGIGYVTCKYLLFKNCKVYILSRSPSESKAHSAIQSLQSTTQKQAHYIPLDLSDLASVRAAAREFLSREQRLDVLFNNAGCAGNGIEEVTRQGYDLVFGVNVLGHAYLTHLLLPLLRQTAHQAGHSRVVTTSSQGHMNALQGGIDYSTLTAGPARTEKLKPFPAYFQSKWGDLVYALELDRREGGNGVVSTSLNPGIISSEIDRNIGAVIKWITSWFQYPADPLGAVTQLYAGTAPEAAQMGGTYFIPWARKGVPRPDTMDEAAGRRLWDWLEEQIRAFEAGEGAQ